MCNFLYSRTGKQRLIHSALNWNSTWSWSFKRTLKSCYLLLLTSVTVKCILNIALLWIQQKTAVFSLSLTPFVSNLTAKMPVAFSPPPHSLPVKSKLDKHCTAEVTYLNGIQTNQFLFMFLIWECSLLIHYTLETHQGHKWCQVAGRQGQAALIITLRQLAKAAAEGTLHPSAPHKWTFQGLACVGWLFFFSPLQHPFYEWNFRLHRVHSYKSCAHRAQSLGINWSWARLMWLV